MQKYIVVFLIASSSLLCHGLVFADEPAQLSCMLEPSRRIQISSEVPGVIDSLEVDRGSVVKKGQLLFSLESGVEFAAMNVAKLKAEYADRQWSRHISMSEDGLLSESKKDELETEKNLASWNLKESEARYLRRQISSPISGLVVRRYVDTGQYIDEDPVLELVNLDPLYVEVILKADSYGTISKVSTMKIKLFHEQEYKVSIEVVDKVIDPASGTYGIRATLENKNLEIPAGINCEAIFNQAGGIASNE